MGKVRIIFSISAFSFWLSLFPLLSQAVTQGDLNPTSTAQFNVQIVIPEQVRISGLSDINFGTYSGTGNLESDQDICVYSNIVNGRYDITTQGDGAGNAYTLTNGGDTIPYSVFWSPSTGPSGGTPMTATTTLTNQLNANTQTDDCSVGGLSANIRVLMNDADLHGISNGLYSGTLSVIVEGN